MKLHLVGGFLGSGKTTAIIQAAHSLMSVGKQVGVVTNDQGKYLVDTAFFRLGEVPAVEVTGGCFCCNYDDLEARLDQMQSEYQPDVIFAESVGSCGDLVATVIKPLVSLRGGDFQPASFSVFTDSRMLLLHLAGEGLPFSDNVIYIFEKQIEEAGLLVINKADLLERGDLEMLVRLARARFPGVAVRTQSSLDPQDIAAWLALIESAEVPLPSQSLEMDYQRYGDGEAQLAWLDEEVVLNVPDACGREAAASLIDLITGEIHQRQAAIGHLKFIVQGGGVDAKVSITTVTAAPGAGPEVEIPFIPGSEVRFLINARVEMDAGDLHQLVARALSQVSARLNCTVRENEVSYFHPGIPKPSHRIA
jgi:Ni2+-binding GTPase involved in maturation of urease and hydrogenase